METSVILGPSGEPTFTFGGPLSHAQGEHRGFNWSLEWRKADRRTSRVLCIWPLKLHVLVAGAAAPGVWVIAHTDAANFFEANRDNTITGKPSMYAINECIAALPVLGKDRNDKQAVHALCDILINQLPRLVSGEMRPTREVLAAVAPKEKYWEIEATNKSSGKTISHGEV